MKIKGMGDNRGRIEKLRPDRPQAGWMFTALRGSLRRSPTAVARLARFLLLAYMEEPHQAKDTNPPGTSHVTR
jgi:hypothetical protein